MSLAPGIIAVVIAVMAITSALKRRARVERGERPHAAWWSDMYAHVDGERRRRRLGRQRRPRDRSCAARAARLLRVHVRSGEWQVIAVMHLPI
jgi:hypothetical protein